MSNELTTYNYDDPTELAGYLQTLKQGNDSQLEELAQEANPFDVMPQLKLSSDSKEIRAVQNDETIHLFTSKNPLYFVPILMAESRALWRPDHMRREGDDRDRMPICSTATMPIGTFRRDNDRGLGKWRTNDNPVLSEEHLGLVAGADGEPDVAEIACRNCKFNQFKSVRLLDETSDSNGKACGEGRLLIGYLAHRVVSGQVSLFSISSDEPMVYMRLGASSIKTVKAMGTACVARKVPARYNVFILGCDNRTEGQRSWGVLTQEHAGFLVKDCILDADTSWESQTDLVISNQVVPVYDDEEAPAATSVEQRGGPPTQTDDPLSGVPF